MKGLEEEKKRLVLERFKTLNPESKIHLGNGENLTVKELMEHIEKGDEFGNKIVDIQIKMLRILAGNG